MPSRPVTVTTSKTPVAAYNPKRQSLNVFNNGTDTIFLSQDEANITTAGMPLPPGTGAVAIRAFGQEPELALYAIAASGSQNVRVDERYGQGDTP